MTKKTKWIISLVTAMNNRKVIRLAGFEFRFDNKLKSIPVEVPLLEAEMLLEMMDKPCNCHYRKSKHLFAEVKNK